MSKDQKYNTMFRESKKEKQLNDQIFHSVGCLAIN